MDNCILEAVNITKRYGNVTALEDVNLKVYPGEILALVGDNGAGKSTLIKILSGVLSPDSGSILVDGKNVVFHSPRDARHIGIETVYQDLAVVPMMDIASNLFLGREIHLFGKLGSKIGLINIRKMRREAGNKLRDLGIQLRSMTTAVQNLSGGQRQAVAVARAAVWGTRIVIMDEPTAALGVKESQMVYRLIRQIKAKGMSVILISHNLPSVFELADRIAILRLGQNAVTLETAGTEMQQVVRLMTGAEIAVPN